MAAESGHAIRAEQDTSPGNDTSQGAKAELNKRAEYRRQRIEHWNGCAGRRWLSGKYYHARLRQIHRFLIPEGQKVLEMGCQEGDLLAALAPSVGVGVDFSPRMIERARDKHPHLQFHEADVHDLALGETFDYIILSDLVNDLWDVQQVFSTVRRHSHPRTRIVINAYSRMWQLPLAAARALKLAKPLLPQNWLAPNDIAALLALEKLEPVRSWQEVLLPFYVPLLSAFFDRMLVRLVPFRYLALTNFILARPRPEPPPAEAADPSVSIVVAARNESGNIESIFRRVPSMGSDTELIFVEGGSTDDTYDKIEQTIRLHPERRVSLYRQTGKGKGDAVRLGFEKARGDVLMILDADLTVPPEDLPRFYEAIRSGHGEFINGVRLVYPMERHAMRFFNIIGNKFFSWAFSWILGQSVKDTLCGTKVLRKTDYQRIAANRSYFGDFDPFGDFDLIFGAAKQNMKIVDLPIRYRERIYGDTNISRWRHGVLLLRMVVFSLFRIKFV